ncbi:hypothetical protein DUNSADRAFT_17686 [Dunaliella salina]|uniref:Encoded protein n=1 Tax=Dunaliella salina TaxID=3046 RepID=A0ABQ7G1A0_DUNSA|nr:hypothetical protein DUNSADRAFT_17686 [Dunaliella salina]|eukprot:KAF5828384.1 hypothetical protein DUNSADRAFT_17686 [Dunaliella salina]
MTMAKVKLLKHLHRRKFLAKPILRVLRVCHHLAKHAREYIPFKAADRAIWV